MFHQEGWGLYMVIVVRLTNQAGKTLLLKQKLFILIILEQLTIFSLIPPLKAHLIVHRLHCHLQVQHHHQKVHLKVLAYLHHRLKALRKVLVFHLHYLHLVVNRLLNLQARVLAFHQVRLNLHHKVQVIRLH